MHEMSLMSSIFDIIHSTIAEHQPQKVTKVSLKVGDLTNALPDALQMAFEVFAKDTIVEGAVLEIIRIPVKIRCIECGKETILEVPSFLCPHCESLGVEVLSGRELQIDSLEVD